MLRTLWIVVAVFGWVFINPLAAAAGSVYDVTIERDSLAFRPQKLSIHVGDTVRWTNKDNQVHMVVTANPANPDSKGKELQISARLDPQANPIFEHRFDTPGSYFYFCEIYVQMWGAITVKP